MSFLLVTYDPSKNYKNKKKFKCGIRAIDRYTLDTDKLQERVFTEREVPCVKLNMLGVDQAYKSQGLGWLLLRDAIERMIFNAQTLGFNFSCNETRPYDI